MRMAITLLALFLVILGHQARAESYIVQVGDIVRVSLPGEETLDRTFDVDRLGRIHLPEVGAVTVAGVKEKALKSQVHELLSPIFQDLINLQVYVYKRQILVNVLGYVKKPGEVTLPAGTSIQQVLSEAGGLRTGAQLDNMHIRRDGGTISFDYKKYLDNGNPSLLPKLESLDIIFIPASPKIGNVEVDFDPAKVADTGDASDRKNAIKVFGEVNSPGSFSYRPNTSIIDLIMRAGGVTRYAGVEQIRILTNGEPAIFDLKKYLDVGDSAMLPSVLAGATVFVPREEEAVKSGANTIYIMGEVFHPGAYESLADSSFLDILANSGGPTRYAESRQIRILKAGGEVIRFDLAAYTEGTLRQELPYIQPGDAIFVPEKTDMNEKSWLKISPNRAVHVIGEVVRPGRIEWSPEMSLMDLLAHVGGPVSRADTSNIEIVTQHPNGGTTHVTFDLDAFISEGQSEEQLPKIYAGSTIRIHDLPQDPSDNKSQWVRQASDKSIYIFGQVGAPGRYMFKNSMNFLDILSAADGPTKDADLHNIRITHRSGKQAEVTHLNLSLYFETGDETILPKVRTGDSIYIPEKDRLWIDQPKETTVRVLGAIHKPGRYRFSDQMTVLDILAEAGGPTSDALVKKITIVNLSCCKNQARTFNLVKFSKTAAFEDLPVLREGDTVYIPNKQDGRASAFRHGLGDVLRVVSLAVLLGI